MSTDIQSSNKRIAKNTMYMYFRMLILLVISLYTSRVIIQALGVDDYGIYNVVAGVVVLFAFINSAMATGTQRHLSYELGKTSGNISKVFSACVHIHLFLAIIICILAETVGLWFLNSHMNFPEDRLYAANVVYQLSVLCTLLSITKVPYDAAIIAYEKMSFYAYISIFEAFLKLMTAFAVMLIALDKLIVYSVLHFVVVFLAFMVLCIYCHKKLFGIRFVRVNDKGQYKYLMSFSGWTLFGSAAVVGESQGLNIIINVFYGVTINAAVGIAGQVKGVVQQFVNGFQAALNPQLVKSQAGEDKKRQFDLIFKSSKYSYFIMLLLAVPIMSNLEYILDLWLGVVPPYTVVITDLVIIASLFECLSSPLYTTIFAIGDIKNYQLIVTLMRIVSIIMAYIISKLGRQPFEIYVVPCIVAVMLLIYRLLFVSKRINMGMKCYNQQVILPIFLSTAASCIPIWAYKSFVTYKVTFIGFAVESICYVAILMLVIACLGMNKFERNSISKIVLSKLRK